MMCLTSHSFKKLVLSLLLESKRHDQSITTLEQGYAKLLKTFSCEFSNFNIILYFHFFELKTLKTFQYADILILKAMELVYFYYGFWVQCLFFSLQNCKHWFLAVGQLSDF